MLIELKLLPAKRPPNIARFQIQRNGDLWKSKTLRIYAFGYAMKLRWIDAR